MKVSSDLNLVAECHTGKALFVCYLFYLGASVILLFCNQASAPRSPVCLFMDPSSISSNLLLV